MSQLSLFATEMVAPSPDEVAGLLAGRGQSTLSGDRAGDRARVTVLVDARWRSEALLHQLGEIGLHPTVRSVVTDENGPDGGDAAEAAHPGAGPDPVSGEAVVRQRWSVSTGWSPDLVPVVRRWRRGAVTAVPAGWVPGARQLRAWMLSAGRVRPDGVVELGLDAATEQHAPRREALRSALSAAGIANTYVGARGGGPALRITTRAARGRLREAIGEPPQGAPAHGWPTAH